MMRQTTEYIRIGAKVMPNAAREAESLPEDVRWPAVPPVALSRPEPTRGSLGSFGYVNERGVLARRERREG